MKKNLIDIKDNEAISSRKLLNKKKSFLVYFQKIKYLTSCLYIFTLISMIILYFHILFIINGVKKEIKNEKKYFFPKNNNLTLQYNNYSTNLYIIELLDKINKTYENDGYININEVESKILNGRSWIKNKNKKKEINIGIQLDPRYVLRVMMTAASIMDSQKSKTKIRFHFGVVLNFKDRDMLKIYSLREKIREDVEFNFYNAKRVETELKGLNTKGPGAVAKLLLPQLLPDDIEKLLVFDTGDLLVLRDLYKVYNWDMKGCLYVGVPGMGTGKYAKITKKKFEIYINVGSFLIDVKKVKLENIYAKFVKYKNMYRSKIGDQDLLNDVAFGRTGYYPIIFGICSPYRYDFQSDLPSNRTTFSFINKVKFKEKYFLPKNSFELIRQGYSPYVIHQWNGKWMKGKGLSIYRRIAQYYIKLAGIWDEMCQKLPGYCRK